MWILRGIFCPEKENGQENYAPDRFSKVKWSSMLLLKYL